MARTIGRYEIREELGRGGMAAVYLAYDRRLDRQVALKLMDQQLSVDPAFAARFEREAKTVASLEHSSIVSLYDYGEADGWLFLVMRYMKGGTLKGLIARGPLSPRAAYDVIRRIAAALDKAHSKGIIHRDLKPANILLDEEGEAFLSDFGIVKVAQGDTEYLTETGQTIGTYAYMSPEQVIGKELDGRSDIYSLGIVLYEMLTGKHPYSDAATTGAMAIAHAQQPVPNATRDNPTLPAALNSIIQKATAKNPADRYATARELALALYEVLTGKAVAAADVAANGLAPATHPPTKAAVAQQPAKQQPAPAPAHQPVGKQPVVGTPSAAEHKRKTPVWIFVAGLVVIICLIIAAIASLSVLGGGSDDTNTNEAERAAVEEPATEEPAIEEPAAEELVEEKPEVTRQVTEEIAAIAGETVTVFTVLTEEEITLFEDDLRPFEEQTGVDVVVERSEDFDSAARARIEAGDPPDIILFPQPRLMFEMAHDGLLVDLNQVFDDDFLRQQYNQPWLDLGTVDGALVAIWRNASNWSLVWYAPAVFEEFGFDTPRTWGDLLAISEIAAVETGTPPWCIGIESGAASGWVGASLITEILLRTAGPEKYDQWVTGDLPFTSSEVEDAFETMGQIWHEPAFVHGGTEAINSTSFTDAPAPLFESPPGCFLHYQHEFITSFFPEDAEFGVDYDYFYLPPIDEENFGKPVMITGSAISLAKDTPAGRATMEYLATGDSVRAEVEAGKFIAPHNDVPLDWYPGDFQRGLAEILAAADTVRYSAVDVMPAEVGAGSFWSGIVDFANGANLDTILQTIDASWP